MGRGGRGLVLPVVYPRLTTTALSVGPVELHERGLTAYLRDPGSGALVEVSLWTTPWATVLVLAGPVNGFPVGSCFQRDTIELPCVHDGLAEALRQSEGAIDHLSSVSDSYTAAARGENITVRQNRPFPITWELYQTAPMHVIVGGPLPATADQMIVRRLQSERHSTSDSGIAFRQLLALALGSSPTTRS